MSKPDFSHPQRMSPAAFFIIFTKLFMRTIGATATMIFITLFSLFSKEKAVFGITLLFILGAIFGIPFIYSLIYYFTKKYYIKDGNLVFIHGFISHENTIVPLDRVHSLRTQKGLWYRLLDMRGIIFDTLATRQEEIELILDEYDWKRLLSVIQQEEKPHIFTESSSDVAENIPAFTAHYPTKNLILAALCQNHIKGMAVLGSFLAVIFENLNDLSKNATDTVANYLESYFDELMASPVSIILFFATVYVIILILWLGRVLIRYYDTTMTYDSNILTFTYGLINRASCRFLHDKICTIWIKRNFLEKKFGFCTLMLRQARNVSAEKEDDNFRLYGSDSSNFFLKWWLGEDYDKLPDILSAKSGKGLLYRFVAIRLLVVVAVSVVIIADQQYPWLIVPVIYLLYSFLKGIYAMRQSKITLRDNYLVIHNGAFAEIANFIKYFDIKVVRIRRSPFSGWSHRVSLSLATTGTSFIARSIPEEQATLIYEYLLFKSNTHADSCCLPLPSYLYEDGEKFGALSRSM